ncbi:hypothetical protein [Halobacillus sp. A5]|uniref:hypothetical protein n=1 Tax=Halobacillus sp. A5 TaxID=2880263 RepID=UPI0020A6C17E|nr:hypothetical protein [Halobacillus sp. A5]MCP3026598.1 hypothetical protein [Halobacillus sp. A5]
MERNYFLDGDNVTYQAADFARFYAQIIGDGVSNTKTLADFEVQEKENMVTRLAAGYAFAKGFMYENTSVLDLEHEIADPDQDRIDRIVLRFDNDPEVMEFFAYVKKGSPADTPVPPDLTRNSTVHELSVAQVRIAAGKSFIEQSQITDERSDEKVCGYIPLHNIYRALEIDENGTASFLNQSFVKTVNSSGIEFEESVRRKLSFGVIEEDTQDEIQSSTEFVAKTDGIYNLWAQVGFDQDSFPTGMDVQLFAHVNGEESFPLVAKVLNSTNDNFVIANGIDRLKKGDRLEFWAIIFRTDDELIETNTVKMRIAKIS